MQQDGFCQYSLSAKRAPVCKWMSLTAHREAAGLQTGGSNPPNEREWVPAFDPLVRETVHRTPIKRGQVWFPKPSRDLEFNEMACLPHHLRKMQIHTSFETDTHTTERQGPSFSAAPTGQPLNDGGGDISLLLLDSS
jgi:hypothetical protein